MSIGNFRISGARVGILLLAAAALLTVGCRQDMHDQPYLEPFELDETFRNGTANQPIPAGTVARGLLKDDTHFWFGRDDAGALVDELPAQIQWSRELLERGQERYDIFCSVCHDQTGSGRGMIVRRGFKQPQPLYEQRLKDMPLGYFYDVATNGFGIMPAYNKQVPEDDRWAIAAYIRVLQLSQGSQIDELPADVQAEVKHALASNDHGSADHGSGHASGDHGSEGHASEDPGSEGSDDASHGDSTHE